MCYCNLSLLAGGSQGIYSEIRDKYFRYTMPVKYDNGSDTLSAARSQVLDANEQLPQRLLGHHEISVHGNKILHRSYIHGHSHSF